MIAFNQEIFKIIVASQFACLPSLNSAQNMRLSGLDVGGDPGSLHHVVVDSLWLKWGRGIIPLGGLFRPLSGSGSQCPWKTLQVPFLGLGISADV